MKQYTENRKKPIFKWNTEIRLFIINRLPAHTRIDHAIL